MSLLGRPSCDICAGLCDSLVTAYDIDVQEDMAVCGDCLEMYPDLVTTERLEWGVIDNHPLNGEG